VRSISSTACRRSSLLLVAFALLTPVLLAGCGGGGPEVGTHPDSGQTGLASYYGEKFRGRLTASGEIFDPDKMTAAHKTLAFGTVVRVTRVDNGRSVTVRVNDRGPFVEGRIIDLSEAAARKLDMIAAGVVKVRVEVQ
jgi:rare lipoprotein A